VQKVASPRPANVYAVDHDALAHLQDGERALMTGARVPCALIAPGVLPVLTRVRGAGALIHFLSQLGTPAVQSDVALLLSSHFSRVQ
jgi:hypothetical protein